MPTYWPGTLLYGYGTAVYTTDSNTLYFPMTAISAGSTYNFTYTWGNATAGYLTAQHRDPPIRTQNEIREQAGFDLDGDREAPLWAAQPFVPNIPHVPVPVNPAPDERAKELLLSVLTEQQQRMFKKHGYFCVNTRSGRRFRIEKGWSHNVKELDKQNKPIRSYCAHPTEWVPDYDNMVAQKLELECNEDAFLAVANTGRVY